MAKPKYSLHLFAGCGGGLLADIISGIEPVCAVEIEDYQRRVLERRFPGLPIWDDVFTFTSENKECEAVFEQLRGVSKELVVAGGFYCNDISGAEEGVGLSGTRSSLWAEFARVVREIRPAYVYVESFPVLVSRGLHVLLGDLAEMGYDAVWGVLSASAMGAMHQRDRIWITAKQNVDDSDSHADEASVRGWVAKEQGEKGGVWKALTSDGDS